MRTVLPNLIAVISLFWAASLYAQEEATPVQTDPAAAQLTNEVTQEIYSPFCPGKTLAMCPSPAAADVRRDIQKMAESGMSEEEIKNSVVSQYGEEFRIAEPGVADDIPILVAIVVGLLLAIFALFIISRRRRETDESVEEPTDPADATGEEDDAYLDELRSQYKD